MALLLMAAVAWLLLVIRSGELENDTLVEDEGSPEGVKRLISAGGDLWALSSSGIFRYVNNIWQEIDNREYVDLCVA